MFKKGLIIAHKSYNPIEKSFKDGFSHYCESSDTYDFIKQAALNGTVETQRELLAKIYDEEIEVILLIQPIGLVSIDLPFLKELSKKARIMTIFLDTELYFESIDRYYAQCVDLVLIVGSKEYEKIFSLYGIESYHTSSLFDSNFYKNNFIKRDIDVLFIGDVTRPNRQEYINYLRAKGVQVETYGYGTENGFVTNDKMVELYNRSKITLNFVGTHNNFKNTPHTKKINIRIVQMKGRITEASMCGAFILNENSIIKDDRYSTEEHIDIFETQEDLYAKVVYYLANDALRAKKADAAYQHSRDRFDNITGMYGAMNKIKLLEPKEKKIAVDNSFDKIYTTHHFYMLVYFLLSKQFRYAKDELNILSKHKFKIDFSILSWIYVKDAIMSKLAFYQSRKIKKKLLTQLSSESIDSFIIYAGGMHTKQLVNILDSEIKSKITDIYDKNELLDGTKIENIRVTSSKEALSSAKNVLISSFAFDSDIEKELKEKYPNINIIKIYNNDPQDMFYNLTWYEVYFNVLNKHHTKS